MMNRPRPRPHSVEPVWASGGPGKSAFTDYRWECDCGHRYDLSIERAGGINEQHAAHLLAADADEAVIR